MDEATKGKLFFIPNGGDEVFEVELDDFLAQFGKKTWWERIKNFFKKKKEEESLFLKSKKVDQMVLDINTLLCNKLEELLSSATWYFRGGEVEGNPCFILGVRPKEHSDGWEPLVTITVGNGTAMQMGLTDLLVYYEPDTTEDRNTSYITHN